MKQPLLPPSVLQEYFRDITQQDVLNLLSFCNDPNEDDALLVPQLGRPAEDAQQPQPPLHLPSATAAKAAKAVAFATHAAAAVDEGDDGHEVSILSSLAPPLGMSVSETADAAQLLLLLSQHQTSTLVCINCSACCDVGLHPKSTASMASTQSAAWG